MNELEVLRFSPSNHQQTANPSLQGVSQIVFPPKANKDCL
jgi:hypothetical protein